MDLTSLTKICNGVYKKSESSYYLICTVTGEALYCSKDRLDKLVQKYGSLEAVGKNTVSRDAKKLINADTPVTTVAKMSASELIQTAEMIRKDEKKKQEIAEKKQEIKAAAPPPPPKTRLIFNPPVIESVRVATASKEFIENLTRYTCWYASYNVSNGGFCDGCAIVDRCIAPCKKFRTIKKK